MCRLGAEMSVALQHLHKSGSGDALRVEITKPGMPAAEESSTGERVATS
jgi:hypothetical protein